MDDTESLNLSLSCNALVPPWILLLLFRCPHHYLSLLLPSPPVYLACGFCIPPVFLSSLSGSVSRYSLECECLLVQLEVHLTNVFLVPLLSLASLLWYTLALGGVLEDII